MTAIAEVLCCINNQIKFIYSSKTISITDELFLFSLLCNSDHSKFSGICCWYLSHHYCWFPPKMFYNNETEYIWRKTELVAEKIWWTSPCCISCVSILQPLNTVVNSVFSMWDSSLWFCSNTGTPYCTVYYVYILNICWNVTFLREDLTCNKYVYWNVWYILLHILLIIYCILYLQVHCFIHPEYIYTEILIYFIILLVIY